MAKLVIIYDSKTGNTENMAKYIAEGAKLVKGVEVILKKIGEPFSLEILNDSDAIILGSPARYAYVTLEMRDFMENLKYAKEIGKIKFQDKLGASFGSYGWDSGKSIERLGIDMEKLGVTLISSVLGQIPPLPYSKLREQSIDECKKLGKKISEKIIEKKTKN